MTGTTISPSGFEGTSIPSGENCPSEQELRAFLNGEVSSATLERTQIHLDRCPSCPQRLHKLLLSHADPITEALRQSATGSSFTTEANCTSAVQLIANGLDSPTLGMPPIIPPPLTRLGKYQIKRLLAEGGMGLIYLAFHVNQPMPVALKLLRPMVIYAPELIQRFRREYRAMSHLQHPNLVAAYDAGVTDGTPFLVMEYIEGVDISKLLERYHRLPVPVACEIIRQAATGLDHAWSKSIVHRDVKPSNLMLTRTSHGEARVKILDLGLARLLDPRSGIFLDANELTSEGQLIGTRGYIAPEQELNSHDVDCRVDVYSLGVTLHELLMGNRPQNPTSPAAPLTGLGNGIPAPLEVVLNSMLAANRDHRPATPGQVAIQIAEFCPNHGLGEWLRDFPAVVDPSGA
ncbi:MAG: serine/threonine protein kinase [Planctomycetota bacterium]|nr:MAG: serine/threonine protein kinase [Planctomycetota bacterium]